MKDISEVIRRKEVELQQLERDVESLRIAARLLSDDGNTSTAYMPGPSALVDAYVPAVRPASTATSSEATHVDAWESPVKKFP